jgi:hypothetical protein
VTGAAVLVALLAGRAALASTPNAVRVGRIAPGGSILHGASALATLVAIDPTAKVAEFRTSCGWYVVAKRKLHAGLWKVNLSGVTFELSLAPDKASGYTQTVSLKVWERYVELYGWSGTLALEGVGDISDAPATNICRGVPPAARRAAGTADNAPAGRPSRVVPRNRTRPAITRK